MSAMLKMQNMVAYTLIYFYATNNIHSYDICQRYVRVS